MKEPLLVAEELGIPATQFRRWLWLNANFGFVAVLMCLVLGLINLATYFYFDYWLNLVAVFCMLIFAPVSLYFDLDVRKSRRELLDAFTKFERSWAELREVASPEQVKGLVKNALERAKTPQIRQSLRLYLGDDERGDICGKN